MPAITQEEVRRSLEEALSAETAFEEQLRTFAKEGDDDEVRQAFTAHAEETKLQCEQLRSRLAELGSSGERAQALALAPRVLQIAHAAEERIVQNLIAAYTTEAGECALYEGLISLARSCGDQTTVDLARNIQASAHRAADQFWTFIPSRSIIAYNILTIGEIDPAVETKVGEASWTE